MESFAGFVLKKRNVLFGVLALFAAVSIYLLGQVVVNTDVTHYLPDDSRVKAGIEVMEAEFGAVHAPVLYVMFEATVSLEEMPPGFSALPEFAAQLSAFDAVADVQGPETQQDGQTHFHLYTLTLERGMDDDAQYAFIAELNDAFAEWNVEMSGDVYGVDIDLDMMLITIPTLIILSLILLAMCHSWFEPVIFFINIGIAVLINMGTNVMFESISDVTQMIAGLLQVVLSMDYAIIFLNRYRQEKELMETEDHHEAMRRTIRNSFSTISGISFTTIVGMLMLVFMSFTIGQDIGFVIAKGVFISLVCVFGVMPALILWFDKWIDKTEKPTLNFKMTSVGRFGYKARYVVSGLFVAVFAVAFVLQNNIEITYSEVEYDPVHQVFELDNTFVVLYENRDEEQMRAFIQQLEGPHILEVHAYATTIGNAYDAYEMAEALGMDEMLVGLVYRNVFYPEPEGVRLGSFMQFLEHQAANLPMFAGAIDWSQMGNPVNHYTPMQAPELTSLTFTNAQIAELFNMDLAVVDQILHLYHFSGGDLFSGVRETMPHMLTVLEFVDYLVEDFAHNPLFAPFFTADDLAELTQALQALENASDQFVSETHARVMITTNLAFESEETFLFIDTLFEDLEAQLSGEFYVLGISAMPHEMRQTFPDEYSFITILTTVAFFVVSAISFKSFAVAAILALAIQGAVFITMGVTYFQEGGMMFLPLIIAQVLLKSRVIDYGILYTANYIEARKEHGVKDAIVTALNRSIDTILTSGLIIVLITFVVGLIFMNVNVAISEILLLIAQGCFIGVTLSIFVLPSLIAVFDRFVTKEEQNKAT